MTTTEAITTLKQHILRELGEAIDSRHRIRTEDWQQEIQSLVDHVQTWVKSTDRASIHSWILIVRNSQLVMVFCPEGGSFDFDLAEQLADLGSHIARNYSSVGDVEILQVAYSERYHLFDLEWEMYSGNLATAHAVVASGQVLKCQQRNEKIMNTDTAIEILKQHNLWRGGDDDTIAMYSLRDLGKAIDVVIDAMGKRLQEAPKWRPIAEAEKNSLVVLFHPQNGDGLRHSAHVSVGLAPGSPFRTATHFIPLPTEGGEG